MVIIFTIKLDPINPKIKFPNERKKKIKFRLSHQFDYIDGFMAFIKPSNDRKYRQQIFFHFFHITFPAIIP